MYYINQGYLEVDVVDPVLLYTTTGPVFASVLGSETDTGPGVKIHRTSSVPKSSVTHRVNLLRTTSRFYSRPPPSTTDRRPFRSYQSSCTYTGRTSGTTFHSQSLVPPLPHLRSCTRDSCGSRSELHGTKTLGLIRRNQSLGPVSRRPLHVHPRTDSGLQSPYSRK